MHALSLLQGWLKDNCEEVHRGRLNALCRAVDALLNRAPLTLTGLGRAMPGEVQTKNKIKCIDRLLGNRHLPGESVSMYRAMAHWVVGPRTRPVVLVDWSDCAPGNRWQVLRAAVAVQGRAVTVYDEVHPVSGNNNDAVHRAFLHRLGEVLPAGCVPVIVTDAGFRGPWFRAVRSMGWDYVGRVRNTISCSFDEGESWQLTRTLFASARARARYLGEALLALRNSYRCDLYLYDGRGRAAQRRCRSERYSQAAKRARGAAGEPWLLATSLAPGEGVANEVVRLYELRMQIEESFRDLKGQRLGFAAVDARTESVARRTVLMLIAALTSFALWLVGLAARAKGWHRHFQANTEQRRTVLSVIYLGREVLRQPHVYQQLSWDDLLEARRQLRALAREASLPA